MTDRDGFGNWCNRFVAPPGDVRITADTAINDGGRADAVDPGAAQRAFEDLRSDNLVYLQGGRCCEIDRLLDIAWPLFGRRPAGWPRVQATRDFVDHRTAFGVHTPGAIKTALDVFRERTGMCRDFTHIAVAFCRCMSISTRGCTGYPGDIGTPPSGEPRYLSGWPEVYPGGRRQTLDARDRVPRSRRGLIARDRDAANVPLRNAFGLATLIGFRVWSDELPDEWADELGTNER